MRLSKTYKELGIPYFKEAFEIIDAVLVAHKIPYYLIGVTAVALQLLKAGIKPTRGTKDIDFALMISNVGQFEAVVHDLKQQGFKKVKAPWTVFHPAFNVAIDLLPFGMIEEADTLNFSARKTDLHVLGLKEVLSDPDAIEIERKIVNVPPLAGMVLLKLVAWSDRPEERQNDLEDILAIITAYYTIAFNEVLDKHIDLFQGEEEVDERTIAARVLGRNSGHHLLESELLKHRVMHVLESEMDRETKSPRIAKEWARILEMPVEYAQQLLKALMGGLHEGMNGGQEGG